LKSKYKQLWPDRVAHKMKLMTSKNTLKQLPNQNLLLQWQDQHFVATDRECDNKLTAELT